MFTAKYMNYDEKSRLHPERDSEKAFPPTTQLEKVLLIILIVFVLTGIGLSIGLVSIKKAKDHIETHLVRHVRNETDICYSPSCIFEASNLLKSIDMSVDPCSDFYSFSCGNWIKNAYLISSLESQFTKMMRNIILRVKGILEDLDKETDLPKNKEKTNAFYQSCMDKVHRNEIGARELLSDLNKFGGWPLVEEQWHSNKFNWSDLMIQLFKNGYMNNMLFSVRVVVDAKNTSRSLLAVLHPSLGLKHRMHYILPQGELTESYKSIIFLLAKHLYPDRHLNRDKSMKAIESAFELEKKIATVMKEVDMKYPEMFYNILTLEQIEAFAPKIPWRYLLSNMLPPDTKLTNEERIMIKSPSTLQGLNSILEEMDNETGKEVLANYMFYRTVLFAAHHLSREYYLLVNSVMNAVSAGPTRLWQVCVKTALELFPLPLTSSYVAKYMNENTKELLGMMFQDIKNAMMDSIKSTDWMDHKTKDYALFKVNKMKAAVGYRDEIMQDRNLDAIYKDINITDNHFSNVKQLVAFELKESMKGLHTPHVRFNWSEVHNLLTANAYYQPGQNAIIIPVGVLQDTVFAPDRPNYINYGSLGMIVGHELTHAFDSIGSLYDADGSYRMWWTEKSWRRFEDKMKCYEKQYDDYYMPEADTYINGTKTLGENIADNGGLQTAYQAYSSLLKRIGSEKSLPGLPFNEKQMFFISFASVWCRKQSEASVHYAVKHSVHTPSQFRVIGSLSNMKEFSEAFNCRVNSTMHPVSRCSLWK